jgi:hypothetical protein
VIDEVTAAPDLRATTSVGSLLSFVRPTWLQMPSVELRGTLVVVMKTCRGYVPLVALELVPGPMEEAVRDGIVDFGITYAPVATAGVKWPRRQGAQGRLVMRSSSPRTVPRRGPLIALELLQPLRRAGVRALDDLALADGSGVRRGVPTRAP